MKLSKKTNDNPTFLICRLSSLGDVLITTAITRQISNAYPNAKIYFITGENYTDIYKYNPLVSGVFAYKRDFTPYLLSRFRKEALKAAGINSFDYFIDLQNNARSRKIAEGLAKNVYRYDKNRLFKLMLVWTKRAIKSRKKHVAELYRTALKRIPTPAVDDGLELYSESGRILRSAERAGKRVVINPGAKHFTKAYPPEKFGELISLLSGEGYEVALNAAAGESELVDKILENVKTKPQVYLTKSILETAELFAQCDAAITNDSAAAHVAAACKLPVAVIYGSTVPEFGFTPYKTPFEAAMNKVECQPCTHIGRSKCPLKHFNCMRGIAPEKILEKVRMLNK